MTAHASHLAESTRRRGAGRSMTQARKEVLTMLKDDHRMVDNAFKEFERLHRAEEKASCQSLIEQTCRELELHALLEEEVFYPTIRNAIEQTELIDEAEVEHQTLKMLIEQIRNSTHEEEKFVATITVLKEYVKHHVKEEEGALFRKLTRVKLDWPHLLEEMQEQRQQLRDEAVDKALDGQSAGKGRHPRPTKQ
ncbi:MAG: hemerythrin domain-containing protein [Acidobacteriota bacterium]